MTAKSHTDTDRKVLGANIGTLLTHGAAVIELHIDYEVIRRICMQLIISFRKITLDQQRCHKVHYQLWRVESFGKVNEGEVHQQFSLSFVIFICFPMPMLVTKKVIIMKETALCFDINEAGTMILVNAVLIFVNSILLCLTVQPDHTYELKKISR